MVDVLVHREGHGGVGAVDAAAARVREVLHALVAAGLEHVGEADEVALDVGVRVGERVADARLGGQVDDALGAGGGRVDGGRVGEVFADVAVAGVPGEPLEARLLEADVVVVVDDVEADDLVAAGEEALGDVVADEAGGAGDEDAHGDRVRRGTSAQARSRTPIAIPCTAPTAAPSWLEQNAVARWVGAMQGDEAALCVCKLERVADGRLEGGYVVDAMVAAEEAGGGAAGAFVDGEAGRGDGGGAVAGGGIDEDVAQREVGELLAHERDVACGGGGGDDVAVFVAVGERHQPVDRCLNERPSGAFQAEERHGSVGGGEGPEALTLAAGHDDGGEGGCVHAERMTRDGGSIGAAAVLTPRSMTPMRDPHAPYHRAWLFVPGASDRFVATTACLGCPRRDPRPGGRSRPGGAGVGARPRGRAGGGAAPRVAGALRAAGRRGRPVVRGDVAAGCGQGTAGFVLSKVADVDGLRFALDAIDRAWGAPGAHPGWW